MKVKVLMGTVFGLALSVGAFASEVLIPNDPSDETFILKIEIKANPYAELEDPTPQAAQNDVTLQSTESDFGVYVPELELGEESFLHQKFDFNALFLQYENFETLNPKELGHLYGMSYQGELIVSMGENWKVRGRLLPGFYTDGEGSSSHNFKMQGGASLDRYFDAGTFGVGALYSNAFGRPLLLPTLSFVYKDNPTHIEGELPLYLAGWVAANDVTSWGLVSRVQGNQYGVNKEDSVYKGNDFEYSVWTLGPAVRYDMGKAFLQLDLGYTLRRKMKVTDSGTDVLDFTPKNTWFITGTVQFQP